MSIPTWAEIDAALQHYNRLLAARREAMRQIPVWQRQRETPAAVLK